MNTSKIKNYFILTVSFRFISNKIFTFFIIIQKI